MKFLTENKEQYSIIRILLEKLDSTSAPELKSEMVYLNKSGIKNLIINLGDVKYCDSSGLSALLVGNRLCKTLDGSFVLCCLQPHVERLMQISQLESVFEITPTKDEAEDIVMLDIVERELRDKNTEK